MMPTHRARLSPRGLAMLLALALLCLQGLGFSHPHQHDGCHQAPPGYLQPASGDPVQGDSPHLRASQASPTLCLQCALASQGSHQPGSVPVCAASTAPEGVDADLAIAPATAPIRLPSAGRAPPR